MTRAPRSGTADRGLFLGSQALIGLAWVLLFVGAASCLVPQNIEAQEEPLPKPHSPPRIVLESVTINATRAYDLAEAVIVTESECPPEQATFSLKLNIADEDTDQTVAVRWFLNYPRNVNPEHISSVPPTLRMDVVRPVEPFEFQPAGREPGIYVVDVVVADEFEQDVSVEPRNRAVRGGAPGGSSTYRWVFQVNAGPCAGGG